MWQEIFGDLLEDDDEEDNAIMSNSYSMSSTIDPSDVWSRYRGELIRFLKKFSPNKNGNFDGLQLATTPLSAEWDSNPEQFQRLCDGGSSWTQSYTPNYGRSFINGYRDFLLALATDPATDAQNQNLNNQLQIVQEQLFNKEDEVLNERGMCESRFLQYPSFALQGMTFDSFSARYCPRYVDLEEEYVTLKGQMEIRMRQAYGGSKNFKARRALAQYLQTPSKKWHEVGSLQQFISRNRNNQFNSFSFSVSKKSAYESSFFKSSSWGFNVIVVSVNSARKEMKLTTSLEQFDMQLSAKSWAAISVEPDSKWYHGGVINDWSQGPLKSGMSPSNFFGAQGKISMYPRVFYVVYKPKIVLRLNKADADKFEKEKSFGISVMSVFGIGFNFGKNSRLSTLKDRDDLFRVELESNDETPQIIAAQMAVLP